MIARFARLCTLEARHEYYGGDLARELSFVVPVHTARTLARARMTAKVVDRQLHVLVEHTDRDEPLVNASGSVLRFGLRAESPWFGNFTALATATGRSVAVYDNRAAAGTLGAPVAAIPTGSSIAHTLSSAARPVTVRLARAGGSEIATTTVASDAVRNATFDIAPLTPGTYVVTEQDAGGTRTTTYSADAELTREAVVAVLEITVSDALYAAPATFTVTWSARTERLQYFVVATDYSQAEFDAVTVTDAGADARPRVDFDKVLPVAFGPGEPPLSVLGPADARIALFRSRSAVPRIAAGRQRLQLSRNGDVIIPNLPQPGADRPAADFIVRLSKPKP